MRINYTRCDIKEIKETIKSTKLAESRSIMDPENILTDSSISLQSSRWLKNDFLRSGILVTNHSDLSEKTLQTSKPHFSVQ